MPHRNPSSAESSNVIMVSIVSGGNHYTPKVLVIRTYQLLFVAGVSAHGVWRSCHTVIVYIIRTWIVLNSKTLMESSI
jgi:hypothetical protein